MKNFFIAFLILICSSQVFAQQYRTYDWEQNPKLHQLNDEELKESSIGILKKHIVEYASNIMSPEPKRYETDHTITRVNDDVGIGKHNTVYIPMYEVKQLINVKARTINPLGKVTLLNQDNIKEVKNVDEYGDFKIFAIEGVEKNSEIEVLYTVEKEYDMYGAEAIQANYPIKRAEFLFITGKLNSKVKAYRTNVEFKEISIDGDSAKQLVLEDIPATKDEEYATPMANKIEVVYQCFPEDQELTQEMFWTNVSNNIGRQIFPSTVPEKVNGDVALITEGKENLSDFEKASLVDNFVKSNFSIIKNRNDDLTDLTYILENRTASEFGIMKVYANYLKALNLKYEIVVTANRFQLKFDPEFFIPNMLRDFLIYLPNEKKYIAPNRLENRVGEAPFNILGNYGLFIKEDLSHYFQKIEQADEDFSRIKRDMKISFNDDWEFVQVEEKQEYYGNWANTNRAVLTYSAGQNMAEFKDYLTGSGIEDKDITEYEVKNTEINQTTYNQPFIVNSTIRSATLLEDAGGSYIFQIGKVIGTQSELYQETERINPIEMQYPNKYNYSIEVRIPDGYTVEGLKSLKIDKSYKDENGVKVAKFESDYELKDNTLVVTIEEFYKDMEYDINRYEEFRNVINAASDFNKASLLITEK